MSEDETTTIPDSDNPQDNTNSPNESSENSENNKEELSDNNSENNSQNDSETNNDTNNNTETNNDNNEKKKEEDNNTETKPKEQPRKRHKEDFDWEEDIIGTGAFGEVKVATDKETKKTYAVKILNKKQIVAQKKVDWVNREKFLLDKMRHPNIVSLYFTFSDPQNLYFVLEYCNGGELLDHIKKHKCFDVECGRFYIAEIINALEFMHSKGVAHRDLKPENILLGQDMHVRICDFGTARDLGTEKKARSKSFVGTAEYVCPELLIEKKAGLAADLWSLGCMIYQIFAGRAPFKAASEYLIFNLIENRTFSYPEHFPEKAKDLIDQLLVINQDERIGYRNGYDELKAHSLFEGLDWDNIHNETPPPLQPPKQLPIFEEPVKKNVKDEQSEDEIKLDRERKEKLENQKKLIWARFLGDDELIIENSAVVKQRGFSKTKRQLIMTDKPRIFYVDPEKMVIKGEVPMTKEVTAEAKNNKIFNITVPGRVYKLTELNGNANRWVESIKKVINSMSQT